MPIITYTPDGGGEPSRFEFAFDDLPYPEVVALEKVTGRNWGAIESLYWAYNFEVAGAVLLVLMRRTEPSLTIEQLDLRPRQLGYELTPAETHEFATRLLAKADLGDEQRKVLEQQLADLEPAKGDGDEVAEDPKAATPSDA